MLLRHGETNYNVEHRFCGWSDARLTPKGKSTSSQAGRLLALRGYTFDYVYASELNRAVETAELVIEALDVAPPESSFVRDWRLNERHYGALQGQRKDSIELATEYGTDAIEDIRRSFKTRPPPLCDESHETFSESVKRGLFSESLRDCEERVREVWDEAIWPGLCMGKSTLVVAHANTLRSLIKVIDGINENDIKHVWVPNSIPLVYPGHKLHSRLPYGSGVHDFHGQYIVTESNFEEVAHTYDKYEGRSASHGGGLLRSLFDSLDTNGDGFIDADEIEAGVLRCRDSDVLRTLYSYDIDGSGNISYDEFVVCLSAAETASLFDILR